MAFLRFSITDGLCRKRRGSLPLKLLCVSLPVFVFCEFLIYYIVIIQCHWPQLKSQGQRGSEQTSEPVLKAIFLSDTHLLGKINGHWLDKLRREWQMERAFQTALWLLQPEIVFILGDIFDEGKWSSSQAWADDVRRFRKMFRHPAHIELIVIVGNHDIGFHYEMTTYKLGRFSEVFNFTSEKLLTRKAINFVMVNSVALEGDGCMICRTAEAKLAELSHKLNCSLKKRSQYKKRCSNMDKLPVSAPVLLQLLWWFHPRLILSGHTHSACEVLHNGEIPEISVPSFSWRNRNNPSFIMGSITSRDFSLYKCFLPCENTVIIIYCTAGTVLVVLLLVHTWPLISPFHFVQRLITKRKAA
ncbi:metallophosphoesterase 1 isoform X2 [Tiliqua scincoides]|uniref:metallophosphoesterase 1 isoform X2 n=1 Tax=Tiliqua scincoides TaxID=71010 RepID=UPI003462794F